MPYVYCLSNSSMPGLVKLGAVHKKDRSVKDRMDELYSSGVPTEFQIEFFAEVSDSRETEKQIHNILQEYRVNKSREFFKIQPDDAKSIIEQSMPEILWSDNQSLAMSSKSADVKITALYDNVSENLRSFIASMEKVDYHDIGYSCDNKYKCTYLTQRLGHISDGVKRMNDPENVCDPKYKKVDDAFMKKELHNILDELDELKSKLLQL